MPQRRRRATSTRSGFIQITEFPIETSTDTRELSEWRLGGQVKCRSLASTGKKSPCVGIKGGDMQYIESR